jgi:hypothetical protein
VRLTRNGLFTRSLLAMASCQGDVSKVKTMNRRFIWWLVLAAGTFPVVWRQVTVSDAWWHVAAGKWLVVVCAAVGLFFLAKCGGRMRGPWVLLVLSAVCLGTYQLQLARNSVFSLALYPALLWLGTRKSGPPDWRDYAAAGGVLVLWSCLHGSSVLGWLTACALFGARALKGFLPIWNGRQGAKSLAFFAAAMGFSLVVMCWGRPDAMHFLGLPFRHVANSAAELAAKTGDSGERNQESVQTSDQSRQGLSLKEWLNSSIWKREPAVPWSNDYWSPLDMLPGMRPIEAAYTLALLALVWAAVHRNVPMGLLLAWAGAVLLGLGYVRMFGYTALASGAVLLVSARDGGWKISQWVGWIGWAIFSVWVVFIWGLFFAGRLDGFIPDGQHVSRAGKVPIYDDATADWVKREFPGERVFTTIETGSYCVLRWDFEKPVFLDGFFAPHTREKWNAYHSALRDGNLRPLYDDFGIRVAIVPTTSPKWVDRFRHAPDWNPVAVGEGTVVFAHSSLGRIEGGPRIFMSPDGLRETSFYFRHAALKALFLVAAGQSASRTGYRPEEWTALPEFDALRRMAGEVFPKAE